ncbi:MAG: excinuclease ABC subunit UvrA [Magnetococcales bacterium]|nr:excinuclease ABC subunit UvrA [Magnetococcales bacterium]MBF0436016.1 excinuclease ABC subunit UvrA [Magnetococcales bacterium]
MNTHADKIIIRGAREHNLKNIDLELPRNALTVITGVSGSGKSSLAFDTLSAEGQRRYVESLSAYARQFLSLQGKPDCDAIEGLSPSISIEQKSTSKNPRSTVGTVTEIHDYLRLLFARIGKPHCHGCGKPIDSQTVSQMVDTLLTLPENSRLLIMAPIAMGRKGEFKKELAALVRHGFTRVVIDGQTMEVEEAADLNKKVKHSISALVDRIVIKPGIEGRLADSLETTLALPQTLALKSVPGGIAHIQILGDPPTEMLFSERHACPDCGISYPEIEPRLFSFNNPFGACPGCTGLGTREFFDPELIIPDANLSIEQGAIAPWAKPTAHMARQSLQAVAEHFDISITTPWNQLPLEQQHIILNGVKGDRIRFRFRGPRGSFTTTKPWEGVLNNLERRYLETESDDMREEMGQFRNTSPCTTCHGKRLRIEALSIKVGGYNIAELSAIPLDQTLTICQTLPLSSRETTIAERILKEINERLHFLIAVGLDYLTLDRAAATLSGGESQRIRLANQIGSGLTGVLYILDEPSIGLHQRDNQRLLHTLQRLRDLGNTVVVVEHDEEAIRTADHVVDMGPGAGEHGGQVVATGTPAEITANPDSLTGQYLSGVRSIPLPAKRRPFNPESKLTLNGVSTHNLRSVSTHIPIGLLTCVTGVSGSGKSSLILDTLYPALQQHLHRAQVGTGEISSIDGLEFLDKVIHIDQSPIGRTPRSNPATYIGLFTPIRDLFAQVPEARARGYKAGRFSFNVKGGRCEACAGEGLVKIEMHFLPDIFVECDVCHGSRYSRETLEILYKGHSISGVLKMTVEEAAVFFKPIPSIQQKLLTLQDVGLSYIRLGQSATTLSGGEAQRVKIAKELAKRATGKTLYILDEPTTGLHFDDIRKLVEVLERLVQDGNTVIVIEHNLDVIKTADWIIDLGPEGGSRGGSIVMEGTPEQCADHPGSYTGRFLKPLLQRP